MSDTDDHTLSHLLDGMEHAATAGSVSVRDIIAEFGDRSVTPFILMVSLLMVSPLSGIPGAPTISACIIILLSAQALYGRRSLWLPDFLLRREMSARRLKKAVQWMRKPCAFVDRHSHKRMRILTSGPMRWLTLAACIVIPLGWPMLEVLPMVTSLGALTVGLMAFGLFTRDGLYVLFGYILAIASAGLGLALLI
ncbi:Uncharacterized conserved protein [Sulfitobacter brevis]|uniref:Uncharacterized conserved protein n=1 Tax=Sulfitobacter brevis TaxID=74348 RepID=A0A1I1YMK0_9RHOB|nr:exopolysaccharide biosynthesis protein [Sulfitobacter brevis]SFE19373.1 Uncharacterized conserved protein [Sulfitobacter brevis]